MKKTFIALGAFLFAFIVLPIVSFVSADTPGQGGGINVGDSPLNQGQGQ